MRIGYLEIQSYKSVSRKRTKVISKTLIKSEIPSRILFPSRQTGHVYSRRKANNRKSVRIWYFSPVHIVLVPMVLYHLCPCHDFPTRNPLCLEIQRVVWFTLKKAFVKARAWIKLKAPRDVVIFQD